MGFLKKKAREKKALGKSEPEFERKKFPPLTFGGHGRKRKNILSK
jgi:hypothetical protein